MYGIGFNLVYVVFLFLLILVFIFIRWGGIKLVDVDYNNIEDEDEGRK